MSFREEMLEVLKGRTVVDVLGSAERPVIVLDKGIRSAPVYLEASRDPEGNGPGTLICTENNWYWQWGGK